MIVVGACSAAREHREYTFSLGTESSFVQSRTGRSIGLSGANELVACDTKLVEYVRLGVRETAPKIGVWLDLPKKWRAAGFESSGYVATFRNKIG